MCLNVLAILGPNEYGPGPLRLVDELCAYNGHAENGLMVTLLPFLPNMIGRLIQKCPYHAARYDLFDIEMPTNYTYHQITSSFHSSGEYRANFRFYDYDDVTIFEINTDFFLEKTNPGY